MTIQARQIPRRSPDVVMRLSRLGSLHQSRLSFMRILTRRMASENWSFDRPKFEVNDQGVGYAVYSAHGPERSYSLVAFAHDLPADQRSDRVIAEAWDATFTLFDGVPTGKDILRLSNNVPLQEAGRITEKELTLSRANRSVRLWSHVVDRLADGHQPSWEHIDDVGYLMRTTAVYGSGKFGAADREAIAERVEFQAPFQVEMLSVYLIRTFVRDLVEHMAVIKGGKRAAKLDTNVARRLGIGNSTGLGMAPFLINHPILLNNWIMVREEAISRVRSLLFAEPAAVELFRNVLARSAKSIEHWSSEHPFQQHKLGQLRLDLEAISEHLDTSDFSSDYPWDALIRWSADALSEEGQELVSSLILEPYSELVDGLESCMADTLEANFVLDGSMTAEKVRDLISQSFKWAEDVEWSEQTNCARAWYVSEEKQEPRLGQRFEESLEDYEQPLAPARDAIAALVDLESYAGQTPISKFLVDHPEHRHSIRRAQISELAPYSEIRDNTIGQNLMPIDMLRAKLSFFGAIHFDPRSDRWVRICMYAGAPYPEELTTDNSDLWVYPIAA